jgi:hypothetical protein
MVQRCLGLRPNRYSINERESRSLTVRLPLPACGERNEVRGCEPGPSPQPSPCVRREREPVRHGGNPLRDWERRSRAPIAWSRWAKEFVARQVAHAHGYARALMAIESHR